MTQPLALVLYDKLLPGSQVVTRLEDLGYRVAVPADPGALETQADRDKPLVIVAELAARQSEVVASIARLRKQAATQHLPIIAFGDGNNPASLESARQAGATLVVSEQGVLNQLPSLLDQALQVE